MDETGGLIWGAVVSIVALAFAQGIAPLLATTLSEPITGFLAWLAMRKDPRYQPGVVLSVIREEDRKTVLIDRCVIHNIAWSGIELRPIKDRDMGVAARTVVETGTARIVPLSLFRQLAPEWETWSMTGEML